MSSELEFLIELVKEAKSMITDNYEVMQKGNNEDLVTDVDYKIADEHGAFLNGKPLSVNDLSIEKGL